MPARDIFHDQVKKALIKDGWTITDDPLHIKWGKKNFFVDLGAERLLAAEKAERKIAVEVKSSVGKSDIADLESALGQFVLYQTLLAKTNPERTLYLAVHEIAFESVFKKSLGELLIEEIRLRLVIFNPLKEEILLWIP